MAIPVYLKSSSIPLKVPTTSTLSLRELGVNTIDGILYLRQGTGIVDDTIIPINPWKASTGGTTSYNTYFNVGNVGIGTTNPTQSLHVFGNFRLSGSLYDTNNNLGTIGQVLSSTGSGTSWITITTGTGSSGGGGAVGGGNDKIFYENDITVTTSYTITSGKNAVTAGPITINTDAVVTIPDGSTWTIV